MSDPENETKVNKRGQKHMRLRYYTSFEEATIVKLWREHLSHITSYSENLQIFRDIAFALQQHGIKLNKQEVRRRISSYRNKYLAERSRLELDPEYKTTWRLYMLIDCLFHPQTPETVPLTENNYVQEIEAIVRQELPSLPPFNRQNCKTLKFEQDADSCPFIEVQAAAVSSSHFVPVVKTEVKTIDNSPTALAPATERSPLVSVNRVADQPITSGNVSELMSASARRNRRRSIMPRTGQITQSQIDQLRKENSFLADQRDDNLALLKKKEKEFQNLEKTFDTWMGMQDQWMAYLESRLIN